MTITLNDGFTATNAASSGITLDRRRLGSLAARSERPELTEPDPGFFRTNWEVFGVTLRRSLGKNTRARSIRQAAHMISEGGYELIAQKTM